MFWEADGVKLGRRSALRPHAESQYPPGDRRVGDARGGL